MRPVPHGPGTGGTRAWVRTLFVRMYVTARYRVPRPGPRVRLFGLGVSIGAAATGAAAVRTDRPALAVALVACTLVLVTRVRPTAAALAS